MKKLTIILLVIVLALAVAVPVYAKRDNPHRKAGNALPDQDGRGMDRGLPESDKPDTGGDWNNGCGNESDPLDREDDNNGRCGGRNQSTATTTPVIVFPTVTPTSTPTVTVCWRGDTPEVWDNKDGFLDESRVITENHDEVCWTAQRGRTYFILDWTPEFGHAGGKYSVHVGEVAPGVYYPQDGDLPYKCIE